VFAIAFPSALLRPPPLLEGALTIGTVTITYQELLIILGALAIMGAYEQFLRRSAYGKAIRAAAEDADTTSLMGVNVNGVVVTSFVLSAVVTAIAGVLAAPTIFIEPAAGLLFTIKGFVAIILGGMGSARGALLGGLLIGLLDTLVRSLVGATVGNMIVVAALAVILLVFPSGFYGKPLEAH
jgi:branched-chain amino acid transport system permease protein